MEARLQYTMSSQPTDSPFVCLCCASVFKDYIYYESHFNSRALQERPFSKLCDSSISLKSGLLTRIRQIHPTQEPLASDFESTTGRLENCMPTKCPAKCEAIVGFNRKQDLKNGRKNVRRKLFKCDEWERKSQQHDNKIRSGNSNSCFQHEEQCDNRAPTSLSTRKFQTKMQGTVEMKGRKRNKPQPLAARTKMPRLCKISGDDHNALIFNQVNDNHNHQEKDIEIIKVYRATTVRKCKKRRLAACKKKIRGKTKPKSEARPQASLSLQSLTYNQNQSPLSLVRVEPSSSVLRAVTPVSFSSGPSRKRKQGAMTTANLQTPLHAETEHAETEHAETEHAETEHAETEHAETEHAETEHAETEHAETEHAETNATPMQRKGKIKPTGKEANVSKAKFMCDVCDRVFTQKFSVKRHILTIHSTRDFKDNKVRCMSCKKYFQENNLAHDLRKHISKKHPHLIVPIIPTPDLPVTQVQD